MQAHVMDFSARELRTDLTSSHRFVGRHHEREPVQDQLRRLAEKRGGSLLYLEVSTRILGRRTAPFPPFFISNAPPHGLTPRS